MGVHTPVPRQRVVRAVEAGRVSVEEVADLFEVGRSSVLSRLRLKRETGTMNPRPRPSEQDQPDIQQKQQRFKTWMKRVEPKKLVFVDESGASTKMGRSHAWTLRGQERIEARPMSWQLGTGNWELRTGKRTSP